MPDPVSPLPPWPTLGVASALLPRNRRELLAEPRAPREGAGPGLDVYAIMEDGLFGYEIAPHGTHAPFLILGCGEDGIPRVRRTAFDPARDGGLRLATLHGRAIGASRVHRRHAPHASEALYADWPTAARFAWDDLAPALAYPGPQWDQSMTACRALESALAIAALYLAEWDPAVDFCGLAREAEYGLPLRDARGGTGTLTARRPDLWTLQWRAGSTIIEREFSPYLGPQGMPTLLPRDASR